VPFSGLFLGPGKSALKHGEELLVGFYVALNSDAQTASCFKRIMRPQGVALPIINLSTWVRRAHGLVQDVHVAVGPGSATPFRARAAEAALCGKVFGDAVVHQALDALLAEIKFRSSARRATAEYRRFLVTSLFTETLATAWERAS
jgi:carbon-monoxide dehydrogenase medium subunit